MYLYFYKQVIYLTLYIHEFVDICLSKSTIEIIIIINTKIMIHG